MEPAASNGQPTDIDQTLAVTDRPNRTLSAEGRGAPELIVPARYRKESAEPESLLSPLSILHALRLRWLMILLLGVPLGAILACAAYFNVPTPYTAYAEMFCQPRRFFWKTNEVDQRFDIYKQTSMRLIKDPDVLGAIFLDPKVARLWFFAGCDGDQARILKLSDALRVSSPAQEFIRIELSGPHKEHLDDIVNAVMAAFVERVVEKDVNDRLLSKQQLQQLLDKEDHELKLKQRTLQEMDKTLEVPNAEQSNAKRQSQLDMQLELRRQLVQLQPQIIELKLVLGEHGDGEAASPPEPRQITREELENALLADREYADVARQVRYQEKMLKEWRRRVNEPHPAIARHQAELSELQTKLAARRAALEPDLAQLLKQRVGTSNEVFQASTRDQLKLKLQMLTALRDRYADEVEKLQIAETKLARNWVEREALAETIDELKATVDAYSAEVRKRDVELELAPKPIRIHVTAHEPTTADTKKQFMATLAGGGGGFLFVLCAVLFFEITARRVSDLATVRRNVHAHVLGVIPLVPYGTRTATPKRQRVAAAYWRSVLTEAFDELRTVLLHSPRLMNAKSILVASSAVAEGKTTSATQLALSLARSGYRVLLIDGDLRRPTLEREFNLAKQRGVCEVLAGSVPLADAIQSSPVAELDLLPAGTLTANVRGLLARDAHAPILRELEEQYNFILIDSSPVLLATDALLLSRHVDGAIVLVRRDVTQLHKLQSTLNRFAMIGVPVLGLVALGLNETSGSYGYGYGYGYGYAPPVAPEAALPEPTTASA